MPPNNDVPSGHEESPGYNVPPEHDDTPPVNNKPPGHVEPPEGLRDPPGHLVPTLAEHTKQLHRAARTAQRTAGVALPPCAA